MFGTLSQIVAWLEMHGLGVDEILALAATARDDIRRGESAGKIARDLLEKYLADSKKECGAAGGLTVLQQLP